MYFIGTVTIFIWILTFYEFYKPGQHQSMFTTIIYTIFGRPGFVLSMLLLIYPVMLGRGPLIQHLLGNEFFSVLSKLTFAAYLFHPLVVVYYLGSMEESIYFKGWKLFVFGLESFVLTYFLAFIMSLLVECPLTIVSKEFLRPSRSAPRAIKAADPTKVTEETPINASLADAPKK